MWSEPPPAGTNLQRSSHRPPQREEQRGTQQNSWGLLVCVWCFRPSREWGWPACRLTAVHTSPLCSTSPNALPTEGNSEAPSGKAGGSYSRILVFRVSDRMESGDGQPAAWQQSAPRHSAHIPHRPPHREEQRGPQPNRWKLVSCRTVQSCLASCHCRAEYHV